MTPLLGFSPDVEPTTPGVIVDCSQIVPYESGLKTAPAPINTGLAALGTPARGATLARKLDGSSRFLVGTTTKVYEAGATTYTDRSRAGSYSLGSDDRWTFAQFGDTTLAANLSNILQRSTGAAFADIAGAPAAKVVEQSLGFALLFNTDEATYPDSTDRWWCSATFDETDWTPDVTTQCTTGRLVSSAGPITAAKRFGNDVIAYKSRSIYVGRYQGPPVVWAFDAVSYDVGCIGVEAVADTPIGHVFVGDDDIYVFDGTVPRSIAIGITKQWFNNHCSPVYRYRCKVLWDRSNSLVWIFFPSSNATECDSCIVYHTVSKRWGLAPQTAAAVVSYTAPSLTYDVGSPIITTYDSGPAVSFDSPFWVSGSQVPAYIGSDQLVYTLTGETGASWFWTGDYGDDEGQSDCMGVLVRFILTPDTASMTGFVKDEEGDPSPSAGTSAVKADGKFDIRQQGRFHSFRCDMAGDAKVAAIRPKLKSAGSR